MIQEGVKEIEIYGETDVLVVGGGPSGVCAAIAAKRAGANVVILERYNHLGGLSTGGLVVWIDRMTDWKGKLLIGGIGKELVEDLPVSNKRGPSSFVWGSKDVDDNNYWKERAASFKGIVTHSPTVDPECLKGVYLEKVIKEGVDLLFHSLVVCPIMEGDEVKGVVFESKEGRKAIISKMVIDASGDGDIIARAGGEVETDRLDQDIHHRINTPFLIGGVDFNKWLKFRADKKRFVFFAENGKKLLNRFNYPEPSWRNDIALFLGPRLRGYNGMSVYDLTQADIVSYYNSIEILNYYRNNAPGFEFSYLLQTANQTGVRHTRRLVGLKKILRSDWDKGIVHDDEIGVSPSVSPKFPNLSIPLGSLIPQRINGVIGSGRIICCDSNSHTFLREIPQCWLTGQAAGVAAAVSILAGTKVKDIDVQFIQNELKNQNVILSDKL